MKIALQFLLKDRPVIKSQITSIQKQKDIGKGFNKLLYLFFEVFSYLHIWQF